MIRIFSMALCLALACSCAAPRRPFTVVDSPLEPAVELPGDVSMNRDAGRGNDLFITLRLQNGEKLPFILDTGASGTLLDKSLEPQLGKRLGTNTVQFFGVKHQVNTYICPPLYLGNTPLMMTGPYTMTSDCGMISSNTARPVMGILGMDVLAHYCIQLDFRANKIRFLDATNANKTNWGKAFPLIDCGDGCFYISGNLVSSNGLGSLIDTGCNDDGWLVPDLFNRWTNRDSIMIGGALYPHYGILGGYTYTELALQGLDKKQFFSGDMHLTLNGLGLNFLSRNLVILDFPERTLYLKHTGTGFLVDHHMKREGWHEGLSAWKYLKSLMKKGRLPGWSKDDSFPTADIHWIFHYPDTITFDNLTKGWDTSHYHYEVVRVSQNGPWKLIRAWRTDPSGRTVQEYPLP